MKFSLNLIIPLTIIVNNVVMVNNSFFILKMMKLIVNNPIIKTIRIVYNVSLFILLIYKLIFIKHEIVLNLKKTLALRQRFLVLELSGIIGKDKFPSNLKVGFEF